LLIHEIMFVENVLSYQKRNKYNQCRLFSFIIFEPVYPSSKVYNRYLTTSNSSQ
jgi:hypothetical protein